MYYRVVAARGAGIDATARTRQHTDTLPDEFIDRFTTRNGAPVTWGETVELRVGKQISSFRTGNPYGAYNLERKISLCQLLHLSILSLPIHNK
ncbi:hypothetical protein [Streptococcus cuniculi]|uniref:hypothetical protein n=1 Tax=Streptococcus cuniculi TaxID=1432788 RepID=UPI00142896B5|nr:hypothetical protein [Streptococcus cuniculi]